MGLSSLVLCRYNKCSQPNCVSSLQSFLQAMERKVRTEERTHREREKVKSSEALISLALWKVTLQKTEKDCKQTKHFQQNLSATFALFPLCLARRKHKLFWPETRELKQERRLRKYFFNLDLTLNVTRNFKEHLFEHLKPIYSDLAQTFLDVHLQFVSVSSPCSTWFIHWLLSVFYSFAIGINLLYPYPSFSPLVTCHLF